MPPLELWIATMKGRGLADKTITDRVRIISAFARDTGTDPTTATEAHVLTWLARDISQSSRETYYRSLRSWFEWLTSRTIITTNPMEHIDRPRLPPALPKPADREHIRRVLASASTRPSTRTQILLASYAGLRVSEIASFRGEYIDHSAKKIRIRGKGGRDDTLPVHESILAESAFYPSGWWFPSPTKPGRPVSGNSVSSVISRAFTRVGANGVTAHCLRHFFATALLEQGVDSRIVQSLMRHASLATTGRYLRVLESQQRQALNTLTTINVTAI